MNWKIRFAVLLTTLFATAITPIIAHANPLELPGPSKFLYDHPYYKCSANYYVSLTGSDTNSGTSPSTAWQTLQHANDSGRKPGDCVNVEPGTYNQGVNITSGGNYASSTGYVTYRCLGLDTCIITGQAGGQNGTFAFTTSSQATDIDPPGSYVILDAFVLKSANPNNIYGQGVELWDNNGNGAGKENTNSVHHVWVLNSIVSNYGQAGLQLNDGEFFYAVHNTVYANAYTGCSAQGSGISFVVNKAFTNYVPTPDDLKNPVVGNVGSGDYRLVANWNVMFNNATTQCGGVNGGAYDSDGNNLIFDTLNNSGLGPVYPHAALAAFNVTFNAGGRGIHIFNSENVTVANNSCFNSALDPWNSGSYRPCIGVLNGYNDTMINNIAYGIPSTTGPQNCSYNGQAVSCNIWNTAYAGGAITGQPADKWANNISYCTSYNQPWGYGCQPMFGPDVGGFACTTDPTPGTNQCKTNPLWVNVGTKNVGTETTLPIGSNFALQAASPAIGKGLTEPYLSSQSVDVGACPHAALHCPMVSSKP